MMYSGFIKGDFKLKIIFEDNNWCGYYGLGSLFYFRLLFFYILEEKGS